MLLYSLQLLPTIALPNALSVKETRHRSKKNCLTFYKLGSKVSPSQISTSQRCLPGRTRTARVQAAHLQWASELYPPNTYRNQVVADTRPSQKVYVRTMQLRRQ
ncbi:hypothetical protein F4779DRAFT_611192 [Xylariaceae sp. FL0662B]|nr:hypothetical protein F4779DRAFT_611192 [Xylariaceae sp. FL0662B]